MSEEQYETLMGSIWFIGAFTIDDHLMAFAAWLTSGYFWFLREYLRALKERRAKAEHP